MRSAYLKEGIKGKDIFRILIDGSFLKENDGFNHFIAKDGTNIKICVPPSVYKNWGKAFSPSELEIINRGRTFDFNLQAENNYFSKINRLRFSQREINIFAEAKPNHKIIEVEPLQEIITRQLAEIEKEEHCRLEQAQFAARDLSGPTRSSLYTGF